ncbi:MAG: polysaccharide deacetylase [Clostridioides sp.]|nr:polysaccharide deacetylase [Clostridioides sp.]
MSKKRGRSYSNSRNKKTVNGGKIALVVCILVVCVAAVFAGIRVFSSNASAEEASRDIELSTNTITSIVSDASEEINKGPGKTSGKVVYLTIDDGPSKFTDQMLDILKRNNAKASFFMIGPNMKAFPQQAKNIANSDSTAGFHSMSHDIHKLYTSPSAAKEEFDQCSKIFTDLTGKTSKVIRIPYGSKPNTPQASYDAMVNAGYKIWDWDIDTLDWKSNSAQILDAVKTQSVGKDNIVVLFHEKKQSLDALEPMIKFLASEGFEFKAIGQNEVPRNYWLRNLQ